MFKLLYKVSALKDMFKIQCYCLLDLFYFNWWVKGSYFSCNIEDRQVGLYDVGVKNDKNN